MKKKSKMANVMFEILDVFFSGMNSDVPAFKFRVLCKWLWILNWSKWILVVHIPTQILITILLSIDLQGVNWKFT